MDSINKKSFALVDEELYEELNKSSWYCMVTKSTGNKYALRGRDDKLLHRVIMGVEDKSPKITVDHIDGDGLNNRKANLRLCSQKQNMGNRRKQAKNKSGFKGAYWDNGTQKWRANISVNNKTMYIGLFDTVEEAAKAYDEKAIEFYKEFANLNFPNK